MYKAMYHVAYGKSIPSSCERGDIIRFISIAVIIKILRYRRGVVFMNVHLKIFKKSYFHIYVNYIDNGYTLSSPMSLRLR